MKISLQRISTKDLATLVQRVIASSQGGKYKVVEEHPLLTALDQAYTGYDAVYTKQPFSGKGKSVAEADEARDKAFSALKNFLWGYHQLSIAPNADKAKELYEIIKTHGTNMDRQTYSTQTAQLKKLIEELEQSENKAKLTALGILPAWENLKTKQETFETLFAEQSEANAELRKTPSATALRKDLEKALRAYLDFLTAMKSVPQWEDLYREINELAKSARNS